MRRPSTPKPPARRGRKPKGGPGPRITVLLVDDHALLRQGVRVLLEAEDDLLVVGEASEGRQAVVLAAALRPDVVVMDIAMPQLNGLEAARQILTAAPTTKLLILSAHGDDEYVDRALALGVAGYVLKQSSLEDLATAIRAARAGERWFSAGVARRPAGRGGGPKEAGGGTAPLPRARLTSREAELLQLVAEGKSNKQVAAALGISIKTVEKHRQSLMSKLDLHDVAGLTRYAIEIGSIEGRGRLDPPC